ncbi:MAG: hypothetical protein ACTSRG_00265 [Candidatus Helarchaeota archaeon]
MQLREEEKKQLKKIIDATGVIPPGLQGYGQKKQFTVKKEGPVLLVLQDEKKDQKNIELISVRKKNGLLGEELEIPISTVINLRKKAANTPWIIKIIDDKEQIFPYYHGELNKVVFSPTFILVKNNNYQKDKIEPYNVPLAGFLFLYNPLTKKVFLEAVSGSVVAVIAVIENLMERHKEPYSRRTHILNWFGFLLSKDSKNVLIQAFYMHDSFASKYQDFIKTLVNVNKHG